MTRAARHVVVTGAGGFIGRRLVTRLLDHPAFASARLSVNDIVLPQNLDHPRVRAVPGDFGDPEVLAHLLDGRADVVFHLAGVLGGAAEADYDLARRVNVDAALSLLEALRDPDLPPRVVFASSIAVFGAPLPDRVDDSSIPLPTMNYGAQKRMIEIVTEQFSARGWIDGLALRLPGIVARPGADARLKSAFLNTVFHAVAEGRDITLPVSPAGATWLISVPACVNAFVHAGSLPPQQPGGRRAFTLPAQRVRISDLVEALHASLPESRARVRFAPEPHIEAQFAAHPPLETALADGLGFVHDGDLPTLVRRALT